MQRVRAGDIDSLSLGVLAKVIEIVKYRYIGVVLFGKFTPFISRTRIDTDQFELATRERSANKTVGDPICTNYPKLNHLAILCMKSFSLYTKRHKIAVILQAKANILLTIARRYIATKVFHTIFDTRR
ncbi:protein of unknown function [Vibrio tapetis subsp. tapetis]|uniref:Uncharacterized protein n=1 Tax=Vibrio tapetis subsp. tapetis TaxID=1671868 RepID=A0A2N8ZJ05_9VIBR|nr:protein of unknown function [Vibrio tapetis subsp. tapetis]